jgi:hypothetical protein
MSVNGLAATIRPPFEPGTAAIMLRSISLSSLSSLTLTERTSTPNDGATDWIEAH